VRKIAITLPISGMDDAERARRDAYIRGLLPDGIEIDLLSSPASPKFLDAAHHFGDAVDAAAAFFATLDASVYGVAIAAGALDPGISRLRAASPVPVVGPGEASMYLAAVAGRPLSVVTVDRFAVAATHEFLAAVPAKPPISSVRSMEMPVSGMLGDLERGRARLIEECERAVTGDGAQALFLGSMTLGTLGVTEALHRSLDVPVFNPFPIAVAAAVQLLQAQPPIS
jgi:allantoin racemase